MDYVAYIIRFQEIDRERNGGTYERSAVDPGDRVCSSIDSNDSRPQRVKVEETGPTHFTLTGNGTQPAVHCRRTFTSDCLVNEEDET